MLARIRKTGRDRDAAVLVSDLSKAVYVLSFAVRCDDLGSHHNGRGAVVNEVGVVEPRTSSAAVRIMVNMVALMASAICWLECPHCRPCCTMAL